MSNYAATSPTGLHGLGDRDLDRSLEREGAGLGERRERVVAETRSDTGDLCCGLPTRSDDGTGVGGWVT